MDIETRAQLEKDIARVISDMRYNTGTVKAEVTARRKAIDVLYHAYAIVLADDVVEDRNSMSSTIAKYVTVRRWARGD